MRYSGHWLCRRHFLELFERRVKKTVRQGSLLGGSDVVLACLSGDEASMTCLKMLDDIIRPNPRSKIVAVSVDEGVGRDFGKVARYCEKLGIEYHALSFKEELGFSLDGAMKKVRGEGAPACMVCRLLARRVISDFARKVGASKVATGHDLDDEIRSAFIDVVSGDLGGRGSQKGGYSAVSWIRPLRECSDDEVRFYARLMKIPYARKRCPHFGKSYDARVKRLLDGLDERHPGSKQQMLRSVDELSSIMGGVEGRGEENLRLR